MLAQVIKKRIIIVLLAGVFLTSAGAYAIYAGVYGGEEKSTITAESSAAHKELNILSEPSGILMSADAGCGSLSMHTPYSCPMTQDVTVVVAPQSVEVKGTAYEFDTWNGCSKGNENRKICLVNFSHSRYKTITAIYKERSNSSPTPRAQTPVNTPPAGPCESTSQTDSTVSCTTTVNSTLEIWGFPSTQSGAYGHAVARGLIVKCHSSDTCSYKGTPFTEMSSWDFNTADGEIDGQGQYWGTLTISANQPVTLTVTVPTVVETGYKQPFCMGCDMSTTKHTFDHWGIESEGDKQKLTTYFISPKSN